MSRRQKIDTSVYGCIELRGARENNLRNVDVDIPKRKLTVVTGVSGSGKSSMVFATVAAESQRQLNQTFSAFAQNRLPSYGAPAVDSIRNLSAVIIVDQNRLGGSVRSTVGTVTDIGARMRLLMSRLGKPHLGDSNVFSFNDPAGMCPKCEGLGRVRSVDEAALVDTSRSLNDGALIYPGYEVGQYYWRTYARSGLFDPDKKLSKFTKKEWETLMYAEQGAVKAPGEEKVGHQYAGLIPRFSRIELQKDGTKFRGKRREAFQRAVASETCPECKGTRFNAQVRACKLKGKNLAQLNDLDIEALGAFVAELKDDSVQPLIDMLKEQLHRLEQLGLGYLSLSRATSTLSGGESQRVKMVRHLGSSLSDMLYVFDEPTVGLHARDIDRLCGMLTAIRDTGNTVLVVEHDEEVMATADHVIDVGPGAGTKGGNITFEGDYAELRTSDTVTGRALRRRASGAIAPRRRTPTGKLHIARASSNNLHNVSVDVPLGVLVAVTGVAGSGKSSLIHGHLAKGRDDVIVLDQSPIRASRRSSALTYLGLGDTIRNLFAKETGGSKGLFSPNSEGGCEKCEGVGVLYMDLAFMDAVITPCDACNGRRFNAKAQSFELRGKSIADVYALTAADAVSFFTEKPIVTPLRRMNDVGLGYRTLGQMLTTLSGGERQRLRLASELGGKGRVLVLDEPTTGLHLADVDNLIALLNRLVDRGDSVIVIEHNLDVIAAADWIVDLGPDGGHKGGRVVFEGTPEELVAQGGTATGEYLQRHVRHASPSGPAHRRSGT